uniref:Cytochrome p450 n=1 Tax=Moniliophthora roreri TaxID=221103 RepID=A0A0W0FPJ5_MONRR
MLDPDRIQVLALLAIILPVPLYVLLKRTFGVHPLDNLPGPPSASLLAGSFKEMFGTQNWDFQAEMGSKYGPTSSFRAQFGERMLYTFDAKAMHHIFVKDAMSYEQPPGVLHQIGLVFGPGVLATPLGTQHRRQRKMLNPAFSIAHMRDLLPTFYQVAHRLENSIANKVRDGPQEIDMLSWMGRTALELIGQSGLGVSFDTLQDEETAHPLPTALKQLMPVLTRLAFPMMYILPHVARLGSPGFRRFASRFILNQDFKTAQWLSDSLWKMSIEIFEEKKRALAMGDEAIKQQVGSDKDVLSILMRENMKASSEDRLDETELLGQASESHLLRLVVRLNHDLKIQRRILIFAASDTTSSALSRTLILLSSHPEVQSKLREEIQQAFQNGDISYDELVSLPYLDAICRETLRLHPPLTHIDRRAKHDTIIPLAVPITGRDGSIITEVAVPKDTDIITSVLNSNRNPAIWGDNALEWKPERWLEPLPSVLIVAVERPRLISEFFRMTFSGGQRSCIGFKFSQLEMKVVLAGLIRRLEFSPSGKKIIWENSIVTSPLVVDSDGHHNGHPKMPIVVSLVEKS